MTLILTCATRASIVQVSDRRLTLLDGSLYDNDTTKAVFYCGRVAVAYTGHAQIEGMDTAQWLAGKLTNHANLEQALANAARSFEALLAHQPAHQRQGLAVVATGWATYMGGDEQRAFVCTISNLITDAGEWLDEPQPLMAQRLDWLVSGQSHLLACAGQQLTADERKALDGLVRESLRARSEPFGLAEALGSKIRAISDDGTERGRRIGKGLIVQALSREAVSAGEGMIVSPLKPNANSAVYVAPDGSTDRWESPWIACGGGVFVGGGGPAGGPGSLTEQIESQARSAPIVVPRGQTGIRVACPFCARQGDATPVEAELAENETERRIYCRGETGHPLLVVRQA